MSIQQMQQDVEIISKLSDTPNETDGLSAQELKEKFDQASVWIKEYINSVLVDAVNGLLGKFDANGKIKADSIPNGVIDADKIAAAAVTDAKIYNGSVTMYKIADGAVTADKLADGAVTARKLGSKAVGTAALDDGAVTADQIGSGAVETAKIKDGNVTSDKLANGAVTTDKIADANVTMAKTNFVKTSLDGTSDEEVPTSKAVAGYVANAPIVMSQTAFVKTSLDKTKDSEVPTSKAVADYIDSSAEERGIVIPISIYSATTYSASSGPWEYVLKRPISLNNRYGIQIDFDVLGLKADGESDVGADYEALKLYLVDAVGNDVQVGGILATCDRTGTVVGEPLHETHYIKFNGTGAKLSVGYIRTDNRVWYNTIHPSSTFNISDIARIRLARKINAPLVTGGVMVTVKPMPSIL